MCVRFVFFFFLLTNNFYQKQYESYIFEWKLHLVRIIDFCGLNLPKNSMNEILWKVCDENRSFWYQSIINNKDLMFWQQSINMNKIMNCFLNYIISYMRSNIINSVVLRFCRFSSSSKRVSRLAIWYFFVRCTAKRYNQVKKTKIYDTTCTIEREWLTDTEQPNSKRDFSKLNFPVNLKPTTTLPMQLTIWCFEQEK